MVEILTFEKALDISGKAKRNLLLGNGFSIACEPNIFHYESLYEEAKETMAVTMPEVHQYFESLETKDFEEVIFSLMHTSSVLPFYLPKDQKTTVKINKQVEELKDLLVSTIACKHPEYPASIDNKKFSACRHFLANFICPTVNDGRIYTLNYDLLLYWALMHDDLEEKDKIDLQFNDGFGKDDPEHDYIVWKNEDHSRDQRIFYLHGAVHIFDTGTDLEKYTWTNKGKPLIEQAREAMQKNKFPLFVAEGTSAGKLKRIKHQPYLHHSFKSFLSATKESKKKTDPRKTLFIFGHSLADNDQHIIREIPKGSISNIFISIFGDPHSIENKKIIKRAQNLSRLRDNTNPLQVHFYDAQSAKVWG